MANKIYITLLSALLTGILFSNCKKIQERKIVKGTWELQYFKFGPSDQNWMEIVLEGYQPNKDCYSYIVDFADDNSCTGTYFRNDSLIYTSLGTWNMLRKDYVYINLDRYVDGEFYVDRKNRRDYTLKTDANIAFGGTALEIEQPAYMKIKRTDI